MPQPDDRSVRGAQVTSTPPRLAAITVVRDEAVMLPRWLAHYGRACGGPEHLTVVDNQSVDGSTEGLPCRVLTMPDDGEFDEARMALVSELARELLESYDGVIFTDADEFLVADPARHAGLAELLAARPDAAALGAIAINLVHHAATESPLDPSRPLLEQRRLGIYVPKLCKPSVKRVPASWIRASHGLRAPYRIDPDLWMFHAKFADRDQLLALGDRRRALVDNLGRGGTTTWRLPGEGLVGLLDDVTRGVDPEAAKEHRFADDRFDQSVRRLKDHRGARYVTRGDYQEDAMRRNPVRSVPPRFVGTV